MIYVKFKQRKVATYWSCVDETYCASDDSDRNSDLPGLNIGKLVTDHCHDTPSHANVTADAQNEQH